jgi:tRNA (mo5U34)-methyltransferase
LQQARWAAKRLQLQPQPTFRRETIYSLGKKPDQFDLVVFMGGFYHLRYPLLGLDIAARKARRLILFQSLTIPDVEAQGEKVDHAGLARREELAAPGWPGIAFIESNFTGDPTNWWIPNRSGIRSMLHSCGLKIIGEPDDEIFICQPDHSTSISPCGSGLTRCHESEMNCPHRHPSSSSLSGLR